MELFRVVLLKNIRIALVDRLFKLMKDVRKGEREKKKKEDLYTNLIKT